MEMLQPGGGGFPTTVHFKGFTSGLDIAENKVAFVTAVHELSKYETIVWDGDLLAPGSFTELLPSPALKGKKFIAYRKSGEIPSFNENWESSPLDIEVRAAPDGLAWDALGSFALRDTKATNVVVLGGGKTVLDECRTNSHATFLVVRAVRTLPDGSYAVSYTI